MIKKVNIANKFVVSGFVLEMTDEKTFNIFFNTYSTKVKDTKPAYGQRNPHNSTGNLENRRFWKIIFVPMISNDDKEDFISEQSMKQRFC